MIRALQPGEVVSYGEVAARAGRPGAARAVGNVLARTGGLPWWRVVRSGGRMAAGHEARQSALLAAEGVEVVGGRIADRDLRARLRPDLAGGFVDPATPPGGRARMRRMSARPISRFPVPKLKDLPADVRERIQAVAEKTGFVPNVFLAMAHRPDEWRAFVAYHDALMEKESGLSKAEREMIVVATSAENDCLYCVVAHGAIVRIRTKDALVADQVAVDWRKADITPRQKAMLAFAVKLAVHPAEVEEADFDALRAHGFSDEDAWDIGAVTALFALSNRMAHLTAMRPNDEFFSMGRPPAPKAP